MMKVVGCRCFVLVCCHTLNRSHTLRSSPPSPSLHLPPCLSLSRNAPSIRRFRSKYHPDEVGRHKQESLAALRNRLNAFLFLVDNSWLTEILLDVEKAPSIIKVLDAGNADLSIPCRTSGFIMTYPRHGEALAFQCAFVKLLSSCRSQLS